MRSERGSPGPREKLEELRDEHDGLVELFVDLRAELEVPTALLIEETLVAASGKVDAVEALLHRQIYQENQVLFRRGLARS